MSPSQPRRTIDRLRVRIDHLERLAFTRDHNFVVSQANEAFRSIHADGPAPESILVRSDFIARRKRIHVEGDRDRTPRPKPPIARLIRSHGLALRLELALLFLRQCTARPGAKIRLPVSAVDQGPESLGLINLFATGTRQRPGSNYKRPRPAMRAKQVMHALDILATPDMQLVELGPTDAGRTGFHTMWLNDETGVTSTKDASRYKIPTAEPVIPVPVEFFTNGWINVLTDSEIWNWLVWRHRANMTTAGGTSAPDLQLDASDRLGIYDLTRDAWDTHQLLSSVGLMVTTPGEITSTSTTRGQRFRKEPHLFKLDDKELGKDAHHAVLSAVAALLDDLLSP